MQIRSVKIPAGEERVPNSPPHSEEPLAAGGYWGRTVLVFVVVHGTDNGPTSFADGWY